MGNDIFLRPGKDSDSMLPTPSEAYRGKIIRVEGATGVADKTYQCLKCVGADQTEQRYFRTDGWNVNGLDVFKLANSMGSSYLEFGTYADAPDIYRMGIRVWKRTSGGVETELTPGVPVAVVSRSAEGEGWQNASWMPAETALNPTDSIVVKLYVSRDSNPGVWEEAGTWTTEQLSATKILQVTWVVYYYTVLDWTSNQAWAVRAGNSTYNSRIYNFQWRATDPFYWVQIASG